jgi:flagellar hook-length control protein FliK
MKEIFEGRRKTMRILDMVNGKVANPTNYQNVGNTQANKGFDMLLAEASGRRQSFEPAVDSQNRSREDNRGNRRTDETRANRGDEQTTRRRDTQPRNDDSTAGTAMVQDTTNNTQPNCNSYGEATVDEEKAVATIAAIKQVPVEEVIEWLQELGITAQDLTDPKAVTKMLQVALGAENVAELLTDPKFPELYKTVNEAIVALDLQKPEAKMQLDTAKLAEGLENLEATVKDGELVVAEKPVQHEAGANTHSQSGEAEIAELSAGEVATTEVKDASLISADEAGANEMQQVQAFNIETVALRAEQAVKQAAPQKPVNASDVVEQIMNQVKVTNNGGNFNEIRMTLSPESLGDIVLRVLTQNGIVTAQFEAESQRVKEALEADFNLLRDALEEQGIQFSELSVSVRQDENEQRMNEFERARRQSRHRAESIEDVSEEIPEVSRHNGFIDVTA